MKKIILVRHGEVTPYDGDFPRYLRTGQMFFHFTSKGLDCDWYTSTFNHFNKKQRKSESFEKVINEHGKVVYVKSPGYTRNISVARIYDHFSWGLKVLLKVYRDRHNVDVIITSVPTISATFFLVLLAKLLNKKVVVEIRDKWPDIFWMSSRGMKRKIIYFLSLPFKLMVKWAVENSTISTVPSLSFSNWLKGFVNKKAHNKIKLSYLGYNKESYPTFDGSEVIRQMNSDAAGRRKIVFVGTIGYMFDLETVVKAAEKLDGCSQYFFAMFGNGDTIGYWKERTKKLSNIRFYGWVDKYHIDYLLNTASVGLAPYINNDNFDGHVPNKIMEYTAYGLPILSSLKGHVADFLSDNDFGATYKNGNHDDLIDAISKIIKNIDRESEINSRMKFHYNEHFRSDKIYDDLLDEINEN
ncbi:glycosyltransferase family 4 protein [Leclercia pneumoniae]|uniref:Glycosyltransferase family 4 protein n=1 Tax=Leclercia pneumoniae TaxID=2815358 RepID=A0ABX8JZP1_9ENTR|nr:glycosyltransferase family 4 protein [Leclercia pneumoniae]QSW34105.1 glycosyltransferase family 4 protein [Leclercia pneumoniae]QWW80969.1 glycosyltransferase family 4 protein [Leclercia pneumoniae]